MEMQRREFIAGAVAAGASCAVAGVEAKSRPMAAGDDPFGMAGVYTALFTPFTPDDRVDAEMVGRMVEYGLANGIKGFYLTGGTGEGLLLSKDERKLVYRTAAKAANGRAKLIAHVGCVNTNDAVELARAAADAGCDWVSSVPPVYYGQKPADVYNHYRLICSDQHMIAALSFGNVFDGAIGTLQNVIPAHFVKIWNLVRANDFRAAAQVQAEANKAVEFVCHTFPKQSLRKAAMRYIGLDCGMFRPPHEPYTEAEYADFCAKADKLGVFRRNQGVA